MKSVLTTLFLFCFFLSFGQSTENLTSGISNEDSLKVKELLTLGEQSKDTLNPNDYFLQALALSRKLHYHYGIYKAYTKIAKKNKIVFNSDSAIVWFKKGIAELPDTSVSKINLIVDLGVEFSKQSNYDSSVFYTEKAIQLAIKFNRKVETVMGYKELGSTWLQAFEYDKSFKNYALADSICESDPKLKISRRHAEIYNYMGYVVRATQGYDKAIVYYLKAKDVYEQLKYEPGIQEVNTSIAQAYMSMDKNEQALELLNESIAYQEKMPIRNSYSYAIIVRGFLYAKMKKFPEAEKDFHLYYDLAVKTKNKTYQRWGLGYLADLYAQEEQFDKSITYYKKAIQLCKDENDIPREIAQTKGLIYSYTHSKRYKQAVEAYETYVALLEQREEQKIKTQTNDLEAKYQAQKKEHEISILKTKNDLAEKEKSNQRNLLTAAIILISLVGAFFFFMYRNRQKTNHKLQELDHAKSNFFTNVSHEFRTPLTLISGPVQNLLNRKGLSPDDRSTLEMINRNTERLTDLVSQLLDISKIESKILKLKVSKGKLEAFIGTLIDGFGFMARQKQIHFTVNTSSLDCECWFDHDLLEKILVNLLSNAIKYTPVSGSIDIDVLIKDNQLTFNIKNTGPGFSSEEMARIFDRFYQVNETQQGIGIGLALVKELVQLHKGTISVNSTPGEWTTFLVNIPIGKSSYTHTEIDTKGPDGLPKTKPTLSSIAKKSDVKPDDKKETLPLLLIVDDNPDVRTYISSLFSDTYQLLLAEDGSKGIQLAMEHIPDIIISDIMMPVTDGITLCNTLKVDERTSHIPIILLTAKAGQEHELEGIKTGADDYITKPFREEILKFKVKNIIANRKKLQERYRQEVILTPKNIAVNPIDQRFFEKIKIELDANLVEPSFGVENLCNAVGMSRMQLHRKLKALTGHAATEFIRTQRLKMAAALLKESDINISQVGYSVGFNNHAYFSKCFRELYHCTPTEFAGKSD